MALAITQREMREVLRDFNLLMPIFVLPGLMAVVAGLAVAGSATGASNAIGVVLSGATLQQLPPRILRFLANLDLTQQEQILSIMLKAVTIPLFWVVPVTLTTTVAADSFVGEKERNTLEPILATPVSDVQLFAGKMLTSIIPSVLGTWFGALVFGTLVYLAKNPSFPQFLLSDGDWLATLLLVTPLMAILGTAIAALISTRVATYRSAYQLNGLIVLPIVVFLIPQAVVLFLVTSQAVLYVALFLALVDAALVWTALSLFDRERILRGRG